MELNCHPWNSNPATFLWSPPLLSWTKIYSCPSGMCCPLQHCHTAILVPAGLGDPACDVAYQSKVQKKVRGVSSRQSLRCRIWNNTFIALELRKVASLWPLQVSSQGSATAVSLLISLQTRHLLSANDIKAGLCSQPPLASLTLSTWLVPNRCYVWELSWEEALRCLSRKDDSSVRRVV